MDNKRLIDELLHLSVQWLQSLCLCTSLSVKATLLLKYYCHHFSVFNLIYKIIFIFCLLTHIPKVEMQERFFLLALTVLAVTPAFLRSIIQMVADAALCVQALMDEIVMLQEEIGELQTCFSEELADSDTDGEPGDQLALQSTLTVLGERMATIRMKASGKRQLLEVGPQSQRLLFSMRSPLLP